MPITLKGMLRIGSIEQKVTWPVIKWLPASGVAKRLVSTSRTSARLSSPVKPACWHCNAKSAMVLPMLSQLSISSFPGIKQSSRRVFKYTCQSSAVRGRASSRLWVCSCSTTSISLPSSTLSCPSTSGTVTQLSSNSVASSLIIPSNKRCKPQCQLYISLSTADSVTCAL